MQIALGFVRRHVEHQKVTNAPIEIARDALEDRAFIHPRVVAEPGNWLRAREPLNDEERLNELGDGEIRLGHEVAKVGSLAQTELRPGYVGFDADAHARISFCQ